MNQTVEESIFNKALNLGGEGQRGGNKGRIISKQRNENNGDNGIQIYKLFSSDLQIQRLTYTFYVGS